MGPGTVRRNRRLGWWLIGAAVAINVAAYVWNLYERIHEFDNVLHGCTLFAVSFLGVSYLHGDVLRGRRSHPVRWATPSDSIRGKNDTMTDFALDTAGAVAAAELLILRSRE